MIIDRKNNMAHAEMFPESVDGCVFLGMVGGGHLFIDATIVAAVKHMTPDERKGLGWEGREATIEAVDVSGHVPDFDRATLNNQAVRDSLVKRGITLNQSKGNKP